MGRIFAQVREFVARLRRQWQEWDVVGALRLLVSARPPLTGEPEIDAIIGELYSRRPQKF
jgi:hypothetical protein